MVDDWQGIYVLPLFPRKFHYDNNVLPSFPASGSLSTVVAHAKDNVLPRTLHSWFHAGPAATAQGTQRPGRYKPAWHMIHESFRNTDT